MTTEVPILRKDGVRVATALVDEEDYAKVAPFVWRMHPRGYACACAGKILMHRLILDLKPGDGLQGDHKDTTKKLDNRRSNLRVVTNAQNQQNRNAAGHATYQGRPSSSRHRGVSWQRRDRKWAAYVRVDGKTIYVGMYEDEDEAGRAAADARMQHMTHTTN